MAGGHKLALLVLAAGEGTRMKSDIAKVLHEIGGRSMISRVIATVRGVASSKILVVVGHQAEAVERELSGERVEFVLQEERLGTGHAVMMAEPLLSGFAGTLVVLNGDTPLLRRETLEAFIAYHRGAGNTATVLSALLDDPSGYGRIVRGDSGAFERIMEHRDATEELRGIREINSGIFCFECPDLFSALKHLDRRNVQGEYYLTDVMAILKAHGKRIDAYLSDRYEEVLGINDIEQLEAAERLLQDDG
jgi:bifunctional UDP-N-acetylglucosamine pyrophosphorylase/glucosamine-1-phosphate N-acetyltransferase